MSGDITTSNGQRIGLSVPLEGVPLGTHGELMAEWKSLGYTDLWSSEGNETDAFTPLVVAACSAPGLHLGTAMHVQRLGCISVQRSSRCSVEARPYLPRAQRR